MKPAIDIEELDPEWLSQALGRPVGSVGCERIGTGQTGAAYRLTLQGANSEADGWPGTLVAKVAAGDEEARKRVAGGYRSEVGFYTELVDTLDVRTPRCWYAAITEDALRFTLLLEDLAPRIPGVQAEGCTPERAEGALRNLAGLHAPRWCDPALLGLDFARTPSAEGATFMGRIALSATEVFAETYARGLDAADVETLRACAAAIEAWSVLRPEPFSVVHGDYRLDNLMFGADARDVVAVDWQTLEVAPPARDLAYFLGTSLEVEDRRAREEELVGVYHAELLARGVAGYSLERCFEDYRLGQLQVPFITTVGAAFATRERSDRADAMFLAMARRGCAAVRELGTLDLI